ncbi:MAG: type 4a pilus biogenesis protein PilO [Candidatus Omnitrophica bacterium]|nr:type 4a pilus biogenesis protein PilO [Candidatus Omnitrophota bacterium]
MNFDDLKNFDWQSLQKISPEEVVFFLQSKLTLFINTGMILVTLIVLGALWNNARAQQAALLRQLIALKQKTETVAAGKAAAKEYADFFAQLPKPIESDELRDVLSQLAVERHIQILEFTPLGNKENESINLLQVRMNLVSDTYRDMVAYIRAIETLPFAVRVDKWSGRTKDARFQGEVNSLAEVPIQATVEIGLVVLKNG